MIRLYDELDFEHHQFADHHARGGKIKGNSLHTACQRGGNGVWVSICIQYARKEERVSGCLPAYSMSEGRNLCVGVHLHTASLGGNGG